MPSVQLCLPTVKFCSHRDINQSGKPDQAQAQVEDFTEFHPAWRRAGAGRNRAESDYGREKHRRLPQFRSGRWAIDHQDAYGQQSAGARDDVPDNFPQRLARIEPRAEGKRNGHSGDEQESGEHQIHKRHAAGVAMTGVIMDHPIRHNFPAAGEIVHKNHHEHHQPAKSINRSDADRRGFWGAGSECVRTGYRSVCHMWQDADELRLRQAIPAN